MERVKSVVWQKIALYNKDGKVLIIKRIATEKATGNWDLPGGWLELNEDALDAIKREIREEVWWLQVENIIPVSTQTQTWSDGSHSFYVWYRGDVVTWEVVLSFEHEEYRRINPKDIDQYNLKEHRANVVKKPLIAPN